MWVLTPHMNFAKSKRNLILGVNGLHLRGSMSKYTDTEGDRRHLNKSTPQTIRNNVPKQITYLNAKTEVLVLYK